LRKIVDRHFDLWWWLSFCAHDTIVLSMVSPLVADLALVVFRSDGAAGAQHAAAHGEHGPLGHGPAHGPAANAAAADAAPHADAALPRRPPDGFPPHDDAPAIQVIFRFVGGMAPGNSLLEGKRKQNLDENLEERSNSAVSSVHHVSKANCAPFLSRFGEQL